MVRSTPRVLGVLLWTCFGCLPTEFTFSDQGGGTTCGNGQLDAGEECDLGSANADDHADVSATVDSPGEAACTRACRTMVAWDRVIEPEDAGETALRGIAVVPSGVWVGGVRLPYDPWNATAAMFSGERVLERLDPASGATLESQSGTDPSNTPRSVFAMAAHGERLVLLESRHIPNTEAGHYLRQLAPGGWSSILITNQGDRFSALGVNEFGVAAVATFNQQEPRAYVFDDNGSETELVPQTFSGNLSGDLVPLEMGRFAVVWGRSFFRINETDVILETEFAPAGFRAAAMCRLPQGFVVVGGTSQGTSSDAAIFVLGDQGNVVTSFVYAGAAGGWDVAYDVACAPDGGFVVVGEESLDGADPQRTDHSRAWLQRYASDLTLSWTRTHQSSIASTGAPIKSDTDARAVALDPEGNVYVAGGEMSGTDRVLGWARRYAP